MLSGVIPTDSTAGACGGVDGAIRKCLASHQKRIISDMDVYSSWAVFAEAGTGKTITALSWVYNNLVNGTIDSALIVCPASLIPSWVMSIEGMTEFEGYTEFDVELMKSAVTLISYSRVWSSYFDEIHHRNGTKSRYKRYRIRPEIDHQWGAIILDESHALGSPSSIQTKTCLKLSFLTDHRYILTGTPDSGRYEKLYGQIKFLDPARWGSFKEFDAEFVRSHDKFGNPRSYYVEKCEELKRQYGTIARLRECYDMPEKIDCDVPVELPDAKVYKDMIIGNTAPYNLTVTVSGVLYTKQLQTCSGFLNTDDCVLDFGSTKLDALMEIIHSREDKIVVFCTYSHSIDLICEKLAKEGIKHHRFDGSQQKPVWQDFQKDDSRVIVVQYQRGGAGINLFASSCMVLYEPSSVEKLEQAKARIFRKGQKNNCIYYFLYCKGTIEERTVRSVRNGVDVTTEMADRWAKEISESLKQTKLPV